MEYTIQVSAGNATGYGPDSDHVKAIPKAKAVDPPPPTAAPTAAPTGVEATAGVESVTVSWTAVTGATKYMVEWRTDSQTFGAKARQKEVMSGTSYMIPSLTGGMEYTIQVSAGNAAGYGPDSDDVKATPSSPAAADPTRGAKPTAVKLEPVGRDQIKVSWTYSGAGTDTAIRFDVGWTEAAGTMFSNSLAPQTIVPVDGGRTAKSHIIGSGAAKLAINDEYLIAVRAVHSDGTGEPSGVITPTPADWAYRSAMPREKTPAAVSQVQDVNVMAGDGELMVTWKKVDSVETCDGAPAPVASKCGYLVDWRAGNQSFDAPERQERVAALTHTIEMLDNGTEYGVIVRSYNERGGPTVLSEASAEAKQTPMMPTPALPVFGAIALAGALAAAGRRRMRQRQLRSAKLRYLPKR